MIKRASFVLGMFLFLTAAVYPQYTLEQAFPNLTFTSPVDFQIIPGDETDRLFVVSQSGIIHVFQNDKNAATSKQFLNITDRVSSGGEMGLLGLAFHPNYLMNGYFYVNYTISSPSRQTRISRFSVSATNPDSADKNSELILFSFTQPYTNHNGGQLAFGPDGYLYIATGDGGSGGDPQNYGQTLTTMLGKILRIDVNTPQAPLLYGIPPTNPFANDNTGKTKEIYAYGMRNPWRMSFDPVTGWLWAADVGQVSREEIDIIVNGGNYGWKVMEGFLCYSPSTGCDTTGKILPIWDYPRSQGYSVTGGYVYRGPNQPGLVGKYIYGDYGSKHIWALTYNGTGPAQNQTLIASSGRSMSAFGVDRYGELYICDLSGGKIWKFVPTAPVVAPTRLMIAGGGPGSVQLSWQDNAANETGYVIESKTGASAWLPLDTTAANVTVYTHSGIADTARIYYRVRGINAQGTSGYSNVVSTVPLVPVELTSFNAMLVNGVVQLNWVTASETNNRGFEVQKSLSGEWQTIGFVAGAGTKTENTGYQFTDEISFNGSGTLSYRLKQIDFDGAVSFSNEVEVVLINTARNFELLQNFPNPFNPVTKIRFTGAVEGKIRVTITDVLGREVTELVNNDVPAGIHEVIWDASAVSSGIYFVNLFAQANGEGVLKFISSAKIVYMK